MTDETMKAIRAAEKDMEAATKLIAAVRVALEEIENFECCGPSDHAYSLIEDAQSYINQVVLKVATRVVETTGDYFSDPGQTAGDLAAELEKDARLWRLRWVG